MLNIDNQAVLLWLPCSTL